MTLYKVLDIEGRGTFSNKQWPLPKNGKPGAWTRKLSKPLAVCEYGYHLCRAQDLMAWLGPTIYEAEYEGEMIDAEDKLVVRRARLIRQVTTWNETTARLFAADCAEHVLPLWEARYPNDLRPRMAIDAARSFARGEISMDELRASARVAGWAAAQTSAEAAESAAASARAAGWAAGWAAAQTSAAASARAAESAAASARAAVWAEARAAALAEARASERAAALAEEGKWQTQRLLEYLESEVKA